MKVKDSSTNTNPFTIRVPIMIGPSHTLVYELSGSNEVHTKLIRLTLLLLEHRYLLSVFISSSHKVECSSAGKFLKIRHP